MTIQYTIFDIDQTTSSLDTGTTIYVLGPTQ
jgi:hypothetical protein